MIFQEKSKIKKSYEYNAHERITRRIPVASKKAKDMIAMYF